MVYKWKPSKAQKRAFAEKMANDSDFAQSYYDRKEAKLNKRRESSKFDYPTAGGCYMPTKAQHDFCLNNLLLFVSPEEISACNSVLFGYSCQEKVSHDDIHIVNEKIRCNFNKY